MKTREDNNTKGTVLSRHLIQSFLPNFKNINRKRIPSFKSILR